MTLKICPKCKVGKPTNFFSSDSSTTDGFRAYCKDCESTRMKEYNSRPGVKEERKRWSLKSLYNLTPEKVQEIFSKQGNKCAICQTTEPGVRGWAVDHDHSCCCPGKSCGKCVRGMLCKRCNTGLGCFLEPSAFLIAYDYLIAHGCVGLSASPSRL